MPIDLSPLRSVRMVFARPMIIGENGIGYSQRHFAVAEVDGRAMIIGQRKTPTGYRLMPLTPVKRKTA